MTTKFQNYLFGYQFLDEVLDWINKNLAPEDIFSGKDLAEWAHVNGYIREKDLEDNEQ